MNSTLAQELARFNRLLGVIRESLQQVVRAVNGEIIMSASLEDQSLNLFFGKVPTAWMQRSFVGEYDAAWPCFATHLLFCADDPQVPLAKAVGSLRCRLAGTTADV